VAKVTLEQDEARLKQKAAARQAAVENPEGDAAFRGLRKHLKRVQRKSRRLALRKQHAGGKKAKGESAPAPAAG
jgi:hypothetical protein